MKAFFLYTELADYTLKCIATHLQRYPDDEIHVVHYPVNAEAPFQLPDLKGLVYYGKEKTDTADLWEIFNRIQPDVVVCSGWNDGSYNKFVKNAGKLVPVILCFDNYFRYTLKQLVGIPVARMLFKGVYSAAWVPGEQQKKYARMLGFPPERVYGCFYATDTQVYKTWYDTYRDAKMKQFPKKFLCVARYIPQKGLPVLWRAFAELCDEMDHEWELWCAGAGEGFEQRIDHPRIKHLGFVQPQNFSELIENCGVFVLPSLFEPWGVVVNEFAAAGFPLLLSQRVDSGKSFLKEGMNGFTFKAGDKNALKNQLRKFMEMNSHELNSMAEKSAALAESCNASIWSQTLSHFPGLGKVR